MVFESIFGFPQIVKWDDVQEMRQDSNVKLQLVTKEEKTKVILLSPVNEHEREDVIHTIRQGIDINKEREKERKSKSHKTTDEKNEGEDRAAFQPKYCPHGLIYWESTTVCMDTHCACGSVCHLDANFANYVKCPKCERVYYCNPNIEFVELNKQESQRILDDGFFQEAKKTSHG
jgi:hypothetical protein